MAADILSDEVKEEQIEKVEDVPQEALEMLSNNEGDDKEEGD